MHFPLATLLRYIELLFFDMVSTTNGAIKVQWAGTVREAVLILVNARTKVYPQKIQTISYTYILQ
jgi:hypothetical protein